jgi:glycosyltransferase involved in cell wall biosynthesis
MYKGSTVGVVIPAYNEEKLIGRTLDTLPDFVDRIIVVDDGSCDGTAERVQERTTQFQERLILIQQANQGVGGAIAAGYRWCRDHNIDVAVVMGGDAQMNPDDLPNLLDPVVGDEVDYAKGNRLFTGDAWRIIPRVRYLGNSIMSFLTKIASGYWHVADSQSGYTAANSTVLKTIDWDQMYKRYGQPNDLLVRLNVYNLRVRDVPVVPVYNIGEKSGVRPMRMIPKLSWLLLKLFVYRMVQKYVIRDFHPLIFFYLLAGFLLLSSVVLFVRMIWYWIAFRSGIPPINALTFVFTSILGVQSLFFAMWFDMDSNKGLR